MGLIASGATPEAILADYPYLQAEDITAAISYAARQSDEIDIAPTQRRNP